MDGKKNDDGKPRYDLFPPTAEQAIVEVLTYGANKYDDNNWRKVENAEGRYYAAARRHLNAWRQGEEADESGLSHLAHAACSLVFLLALEREAAKLDFLIGGPLEFVPLPDLEDTELDLKNYKPVEMENLCKTASL
jgi:hypothetical protein